MSTIQSVPKRRRLWPWGGVGFAAFFIVGQLASEATRTGDIPMPDAPASEVVEFFSTNTLSSTVLGAALMLSGLSLLFLVGRAAADMRPGIAARFGVIAGRAASISLTISGALSIALAATAASAAPGTVEVLRDINFRTGGVVHVVALGLFAGLWCLNSTTMGRGLSVTGRVLAAPAVASIASLFWYYASVLLPLGRFSLMIWVVFAAVSLLRRNRTTAA